MTSTVCLPILPLLMLPILPLPAVTMGCAVPSCCLPDKFQSIAIELVQANKPVYAFSRMAIDYTAEKIVFLDYERDASVTPITDTFLRRTVVDYRAGVRMIYSTDSSGSCTSWPDNITPFQCVPANSTYVGEHYMGFNNSIIPAYLYQNNYKQIGYTDFSTIAFQRLRVEGSSQDACVPLFLIASTTNNLTFTKPTVYTEFKPFISSDFNMTTGC